MVAMIWMTPWSDKMKPMDFVESANPPVNQKGRRGGMSASGILKSTGRSCSADIVWLKVCVSATRSLHMQANAVHQLTKLVCQGQRC